MAEPPVVSDPRVLRAIAHPTRSRILSELSAAGTARAADLARDLGIPANQASFHLRQLAKYGLVEEAPDQARDRRDRVWRASAEHGYRVNLKTLEQTAGGEGAVAVYKDHLQAWAGYLVDQAMQDNDAPDGSGGDGADANAEVDDTGNRRSIIDSAVRLTADERDEFAADVAELLDRWGDRARDRSVPRRTYSFFLVFQPYPPLASHTDQPRDGADASDT